MTPLILGYNKFFEGRDLVLFIPTSSVLGSVLCIKSSVKDVD
jgi:hypothetical protein